jgi:hypothetical protein
MFDDDDLREALMAVADALLLIGLVVVFVLALREVVGI